MTLADMVMAIDPGIQLFFRIVEMKRREALDPDTFVEFTERAVVSLLRANIIASRERVRGVEAHPQPVACASGVSDLADLLEAVANIGSLAGSDFECDFGAIAGTCLMNLIERFCDGLDPGQFADPEVCPLMRE